MSILWQAVGYLGLMCTLWLWQGVGYLGVMSTLWLFQAVGLGLMSTLFAVASCWLFGCNVYLVAVAGL